MANSCWMFQKPASYDAVKSDVVNGVRRLRELKVFEVSIVVAPMNELAVVTAVNLANRMWEQVKTFRTILAECRKSFA